MLLPAILLEGHLSTETENVVKLGTGYSPSLDAAIRFIFATPSAIAW